MNVAELAKKKLDEWERDSGMSRREALQTFGADVLAAALKEVREIQAEHGEVTEFSVGWDEACERIAARLEGVK
jgi:hypothetical protein